VRRHAPLAARSAEALTALLERVLPRPALLLELGSGTGEHAVHAAARLPWLTWQPSDPDPASRASAAAWTAHLGLGNVLPPLDLDLLAPAWRLRRADAVLCAHVLHLAPAGSAEALLEGAAQVLAEGGVLVVVGPADAVPALSEAASRRDLTPIEAAPLPGGPVALALRRAGPLRRPRLVG
jgi:SAM-dependent methyltransferase